MEIIDQKDGKKNDAVYLFTPSLKKIRISLKLDDWWWFNDSKWWFNDSPSLQPELRHLLMRWRLKPICLVADVVNMYRQVKVADQDNNYYQRILWRENYQDEIKDYKLLTFSIGPIFSCKRNAANSFWWMWIYSW